MDTNKRYWLYAPGDNAKYWDEFYKQGIMAIGWDEIGDLSKYSNREEMKTAIKTMYNRDNNPTNDTCCTWDFANTIKKGDLVIAKQGRSRVIGYGIVTSDYYYDENRDDYRNVRKIDWKCKGEWRQPDNNVIKTLTDITNYPEYLEKILKLFTMTSNTSILKSILLHKKNIILQGAPGVGKTYITASLALSICGVDDVDLSDHKAVMERYEELQQEGRIGFCTFHQSMDYEDFVEGIKPKTENGQISYNVEDGIFKLISDKARFNLEDSQKTEEEISAEEHTLQVFSEFCKDIQSQLDENGTVELSSKTALKIKNINYKDDIPFTIQIGREDSDPSQSLTFEMIKRDYHNYTLGKIKSYADIAPRYTSKSPFHGNADYYFYLFEKMADFEHTYMKENLFSAKKVEEHKFILIIDEINRGNVSKIFGELITLLESDKRIGGDHPLKVTLPYSKEEFGVPSNLYIIGTMNTTDRSVGNIDYAVRRRFAFYTLESQREAVEKNSNTQDAVRLYDAVKEFINKNKLEMEFDDLMVGHSYFFATDDDELQMKWQYEIVPLLKEYYKDGLIKQDIPPTTTYLQFVGSWYTASQPTANDATD